MQPIQSARMRMSVWVLGLLIVVALTTGCRGQKDKLHVNAPLRSPYPAQKLWAVAPLANETGVSIVDRLRMAELVAAEVDQIQDVSVVPVQRVLDAMRAMDIGQIDTVAQAQTLARILSVDGILVGSIYAYDPYNPPKLGLALQLYTPTDQAQGVGVDPREFRAAVTDSLLPGLRQFDQPVASVSGTIDAADNRVRLDLKSFARGRTDPLSAFGPDRFLVSMDLYTQYVSHRLLADLLSQERIRLSQRQMVDRELSWSPSR